MRSFFKPPFPFRSSLRALRGLLPEGLSKQTRNLIYHTSRIMTSSLREQLLRQEPWESPERAPGGKGGFRGSPPSVKRTSIIVTVEIFQAFHYWEARAPSTYYSGRLSNDSVNNRSINIISNFQLYQRICAIICTL